MSKAAAAIAIVVEQFVEDAAALFTTRSRMLRWPHVRLSDLQRIDYRLSAHLDGIVIAGDFGWQHCEATLAAPEPGVLFAATVAALQTGHADRLERLIAVAQAMPEAAAGLTAAYGWCEPKLLRGLVPSLLKSTNAFRRRLGITASALHRVDPGLGAGRNLDDSAPSVRARALRTVGELGRHELTSTLIAAMRDSDEECRAWAAWSAVLLGDRKEALEALIHLARVAGPFRERAFSLAMRALPAMPAHEFLRYLRRNDADVRWLIRGAGLSGDPMYVPWLIGQMADDGLAQVCGEAFSFITGADLAELDLERRPPENLQTGPNDDPADADVSMDEDDGLPWPDAARVQAWWKCQGARFVAGNRYFLGTAPAPEHFLHVLRTGYQRQRIAAALHGCLSAPGTPLFEWRAVARRQERELLLPGNTD